MGFCVRCGFCLYLRQRARCSCRGRGSRHCFQRRIGLRTFERRLRSRSLGLSAGTHGHRATALSGPQASPRSLSGSLTSFHGFSPPCQPPLAAQHLTLFISFGYNLRLARIQTSLRWLFIGFCWCRPRMSNPAAAPFFATGLNPVGVLKPRCHVSLPQRPSFIKPATLRMTHPAGSAFVDPSSPVLVGSRSGLPMDRPCFLARSSEGSNCGA